MLQSVLHRYLGKNLRREGRQLIKLNLASLAKGIPDSENTRIKQTDNITRICFRYDIPILGKELLRL
ncbi:hypothetical protein D3C77_512570 [compost metagenome]